MRYPLLYFCCLLAVLAGHEVMGSPAVSPSEEVRFNFQKLIETNSCPNCNLSGAVLNRIDLSGANLEGANLAGAQLYLASLAGANLRNANLQGAALGGADLAGADLRGANLTGAVIEGAYLKGAKMDGTVTVRRPYLEEGGPGIGETVYIEDEAKSKNLPFTDTAFVAGQAEADTGGIQNEPGEPDDAEDQVEPPARRTGGEAAAPVQAPPQDDAVGVQEPVSAESKKLVMMADAVVPQDTPDTGVESPAAEPPEKPGPPEEAQPAEKEPETLAEIASLEPSSVEERVEQVASTGAVEDHLDPAPRAAQDRENIEEPQSAEEAGGEREAEQMEGDSDDMRQAPPPEDDSAEKAGLRSGQAIQDLDMIVAEAPTPTGSSAPPEMAVEEQQVPAPPVRRESIPGGEAAVTQPENIDGPGPLLEQETEPARQEQSPAAQGPEEAETQVAGQIHEPEDASAGSTDTAAEEKQELVERLLDDNRCIGCDLSGVDLSGRDLEEADLERAVLQGANLSGADLSEANLKGADLRGADLQNADFREADLYRADLREADLTGARFEEALMDMVLSSGAIGADFTGALTGN